MEGKGGKRTEDFPTFAEALVVDRIDDVDDSVAVAVVFGPDGPDSTLAPEIPELEHGRGQRYLPGCMKVCVCVRRSMKRLQARGTGSRVLFWPTVGAILSGDRPGVSLYIVLIFSRRVCKERSEMRRLSCFLVVALGARTVLPAPSRPMMMTENSSFL